MTTGSFVGFLPLVGPKTYPPRAVLWGFGPWWALKHTHHGHFCGVFAPGHTKNMSTMISALLVFQGGAPKTFGAYNNAASQHHFDMQRLCPRKHLMLKQSPGGFSRRCAKTFGAYNNAASQHHFDMQRLCPRKHLMLKQSPGGFSRRCAKTFGAYNNAASQHHFFNDTAVVAASLLQLWQGFGFLIPVQV